MSREIDVRVAREVMGEICRDYSTDITAAWSVVDKMRDEGYWMELIGPMNPRDEWVARFVQINWVEDASADTAPMAICLAALEVAQANNKGVGQ
jgi:hypothetical protein